MSAWLDAHLWVVGVAVWAPFALLVWTLFWCWTKDVEDRQRRVEWQRGPGDETTHRYRRPKP